MVKHVIVDGSNIATEGRSKPSLKQLHEAVVAFLEEHPKAAVTVIVDATFGHRIDPKEVAAFNKAVEHNELVTPPAGTVGRGDAFVLSIAEKAEATILSNDSYQEFHGQYKWLFDEGRLIGGKPVPNVGWVFVERLPVRGEKSRLSERVMKKSGTRSSGVAHKVSAEAMKPMPVPKTPPPGASLPSKKSSDGAASSKRVSPKKGTLKKDAQRNETGKSVNEILPFLQFVESHGVGSLVEGIVESYSSHGAYVQIGELRGYVPLRYLGDPPPRSAREAMKLGELVTLEVVEVIAARRSVNLKPAAPGRIKRSPSTKVAGKKVVAKKVPGKKLTVTKEPVKTRSIKKVVARKTAATKSAPKSVAKKKTAPTKAATKKSGSSGVIPKKTGSKVTTMKKAVSKKSASKSASRKTSGKK